MLPMGLDRVYGALSSGTRREMVDRLAVSPAQVTTLAAAFPISLAAASKHIRVLEAAGLISRRVTGRDHLLALAPDGLVEATAWLAGYRRFWDERLANLERELRGDPR